MDQKPLVLVLIGSKTDEPKIATLLDTFREFKVGYKMLISSAHRNPTETASAAENARSDGYEVVVAAAGLSAHLPGFIASHTTLPVVGIPLISGPLQGIDALLSILQMPGGVPVATVGLHDGAPKNAALFTIQILALKHPEYESRLVEYKNSFRK